MANGKSNAEGPLPPIDLSKPFDDLTAEQAEQLRRKSDNNLSISPRRVRSLVAFYEARLAEAEMRIRELEAAGGRDNTCMIMGGTEV